MLVLLITILLFGDFLFKKMLYPEKCTVRTYFHTLNILPVRIIIIEIEK